MTKKERDLTDFIPLDIDTIHKFEFKKFACDGKGCNWVYGEALWENARDLDTVFARFNTHAGFRKNSIISGICYGRLMGLPKTE